MGWEALIAILTKSLTLLAWPPFSLLYPLYASIRTMESDSRSSNQRCLAFWVLFSLSMIVEWEFAVIFNCLPWWPHVKSMAIILLLIPYFGGALYIYKHLIKHYFTWNICTRTSNIFSKKLTHFVFDEDSELVDVSDQTIIPSQIQEKKFVVYQIYQFGPICRIQKGEICETIELCVNHGRSVRKSECVRGKNRRNSNYHGERLANMEEKIERLEVNLKESMMSEIRKTLRKSNEDEQESSNKKEKDLPEKGRVSECSELDEYCMAGKKVELPSFCIEDPIGWITRAETYFEVQNTYEEVRIKLVKLCMEGSTLHWFNLLKEIEDPLTWKKFIKGIGAKFGGRTMENPYEELTESKQMESVEEYIEAFEFLSSQGIYDAAGCDSTKSNYARPTVKKQFQKKWSCALCQISTASENCLAAHLQGKKHKAEENELRVELHVTNNTYLLSSKGMVLLMNLNQIANILNPVSRSIRWCEWIKPEFGWTKLNTDGSINRETAAFGGLLRDYRGEPICAFVSKASQGDVFMVELWAIWRGLVLSLSLGITAIWVESDSMSVVKTINKEQHSCQKADSCLKQIWKLLRKFDKYHISHTWRESNSAADHLSKMVLCGNDVVLWPVDFPYSLHNIIKDDAKGKKYPRR